VLSIQGEPIAWWDELEKQVRTRPGERLGLDVEREGRRFDLEVEVEERAGLDIFRLNSDVGWLGLQHARQKAVVGITSTDTPAARAGLRSGDRVARVGETPVEDWTTFAEAYARRKGSVELTVIRGAGEDETESRLSVPALGSVAQLGVIPAVVLVASVSEGKPAERAGIEPGDLIVAADDTPLGSFLTFQETVLASKGRVLEILVARDGETRRLSVRPELTRLGDGGMGEELYLIGIRGEDATLSGALATDRVRNPFVAFPRAVTMTVELTRIFLSGFQKIISGEISRRNIGGPIEIAKQSHLALRAGWDRFLNLLILISINLVHGGGREALTALPAHAGDRPAAGARRPGRLDGLRLLERHLPPLVELPRVGEGTLGGGEGAGGRRPRGCGATGGRRSERVGNAG
jgi:regulator of sigma E protease